MLILTLSEFTLLLNLCCILIVNAGLFHSLEKIKSIRHQHVRPVARMWNASSTTYRNHPYFGLLTFRTRNGCFTPSCGGVFITPQIFMTAAHCLMKMKKIPAASLRVRYGVNRAKTTSGNWQQFGKGFDNSVAGTFVHPLYVPTKSRFHTRNQSADIGLVKLTKPIRHSSFIARLPKPGEEENFIWEGQSSTFVSAGGSFGSDSKDTLKQAEVVLWPCVGVGDQLDDFQACSEVRAGFARGCPGDSGSPFISHGQRSEVVIAVLSGGHGDCETEKDLKEDGIMYAARVSPAMPWILNTIQIHTHCHCLHALTKEWADYYEEDIDLE